MKQIIFSLCAGLMLTMVACKSGPSSSDPKATLTSFFQALAKKDVQGAKKYATKESESMFAIMEMAMQTAEKMKVKETDDEMKKFEDVTFGDAKIDGDRATVPVTEKKGGETTDFVLKKEDGAWKVAFDKATMAEMAGKKMQQEGGDDVSIDSINNALQHVNTDSLKAKMEEGLKAIDSLSKSMKK